MIKFSDFLLNDINEKKVNIDYEKLNEAAELNDDQEIKIIMLTNMSEESKSVSDFEKKCKKSNVPFCALNVNICELVQKEDGFEIYDDENKIKINPDNSVFLCRRGVVNNTYTKSIVKTLQHNGFFVINSIKSILHCENKFVTNQKLKMAGLPVPRFSMLNSVENLENDIKKIGGKFPIVLKTLSGSQGIGVSIVDSLTSLKSIIQTIWKINSSTELLIQEKIDSDFDIRIHVLTHPYSSNETEDKQEVIAQMKRIRVGKDFRTNYSLGGDVDKIELSDEQIDLAKRAASSLGAIWCGVDLIVDKKTGKDYLLEVNASPGTDGINKASGIDVTQKIIDFVKDKQNWSFVPKTIGFREVVTIPGVGDFVAKFDSGNGSLSCSVTYDEFKVSEDEKTAIWKIGDIEKTVDILDVHFAEVGDKKDKRYATKLDLIFDGKKYKDVWVSFNDRSSKSTKFLINRAFMSRIGCVIDPKRKFLVSQFEGFKAIESKKNPHYGIKFEKDK